ncbi:MAG: SpoIID/LytB domain-containing protein, partial [Eubacteriales bacterium]|nr:SpoIID/LytB domain-containing protein [Eubacteriales bacterium]
ICSDSGCCQAYDGDEALKKRWGANYAGNMEKLHAAVSATAGEALFYEDALIEALYHAASGGATEDSQHVFSAALPYLISVSSENEVGSSNLQNTETYTRRSFEKAINAAFPNAKIKRAKLEEQVEVLSRYPSGRVESLRLGSKTVTGREFREALELRSAMFTIEIGENDVRIETRGYGHGVGMSQTGANGMAREGADYRAILCHYYTGVEVKAYRGVR